MKVVCVVIIDYRMLPITIDYYRLTSITVIHSHVPFHVRPIPIKYYQFLPIIFATRYSTASFLGRFFIRANKMLTLSIGVLPSGCALL